MARDIFKAIDLTSYHRIMIIGAPGSGKSRAARRLAELSGLPLIHLDTEYWLPDRRHVEKEEWKKHVARLADGDNWIIDGNFSGTLEERLCRAELAICLDPAPIVSLYGVLSRRGKPRPDMPDYFVEKLNKDYLEFCRYSLTFRRKNLPKLLGACAMHPEVALLHIKSRKETDKLLAVAQDQFQK